MSFVPSFVVQELSDGSFLIFVFLEFDESFSKSVMVLVSDFFLSFKVCKR